MSSIVLGSVGTVAGGIIGGPMGAAIGGFLGSAAGSVIDQKLFGNDRLSNITLGRLSDLSVQSSAYGRMIPVVYGDVRIAGNIIWSLPIKEVAVTSTSSAGGGKGGGGGTVTQSQTHFEYYITLAIAICEGEIDDVIRVWADAEVLDTSKGVFRLYKGSEDQLPDSLIESIEGVEKTPAYRGLAYVVIEDFPLADYGNRIPNFTFEVKRKVLLDDTDDDPLEGMIKSMVLIPGSGEFVYDDTVQFKINGEYAGGSFAQAGNKTRINQNNRSGKADALVALDQLQAACPNLEWVAVVVTWFGTSIDAGDCVVLPGVEYHTGAITEPDTWSVAGFNRSTAHQISLDADSRPIYGGTPNDASLLRYLQEIKSRGLNIMFYPMFFMDVTNKPWRGRVTGTPSEVSSFFTKTNGYNSFVNHYANLVKDDVDAFIIGSELIGLTSVQDTDNSFPAVDELVSLAASVKTTVGSGVKVTYAADWSEYHHTSGGWYNMDPLWASSNIDFVGIDAYFPLSDSVQNGYDKDALIAGWTSGEGYDWYYTNPERTTTSPLSPEYAWKNIQWWWQNNHINPDSSTTAWVPESKKIWFTEYGYPSLDGCANQPNVFYDPNSSESSYPYHSRGRVDFRAQRTALTATEEKWAGSAMIERMFVWTWDARPFPFWPDLLNIWGDGALWKTGHWVNGKLGISGLAAIVKDISARVGLDDSLIDVTRLTDLVDGYVINMQVSARDAVDMLRRAYFFDAVESDGVVKYVPRGGGIAENITSDKLIALNNGENGKLIAITREQELELPQKIDILYMNKIADYQTGNQHSQRLTTSSVGLKTITLPVVMGDLFAKIIADKALYNSWLERNHYEFSLPIEYAALEPTDIITVSVNGATHTVRVVDTYFGSPGIVRIRAVAEDVSVYDFYAPAGEIASQTGSEAEVGATRFAILDIPPLPADAEEQGNLRFAVSGLEEGWYGAVIFRSDDDGANYAQLKQISSNAVIGVSNTVLADGTTAIFDEENSVTVTVVGNSTLSGTSEIAVLNGANAAKLGDEIIQFKNAELISEGKYTLSGLLRGRLGTEWATSSHAAGEDFVLIDNRVVKEIAPNNMIGLSRKYKAVSVGDTIDNTDAVDFTYNAVCLKPFSPVHITGARDGSSNLTITWVRRTRINGHWADNVDVPVGELSEAYEIDIMNGSNVVRTISSITSASANYSAADQTTDFGSPQSSVTVKIYQISAIVGRGYAGVGVV